MRDETVVRRKYTWRLVAVVSASAEGNATLRQATKQIDEISIDGNSILDYSSPLGRGGVISGGLVSPMPPATPTGSAHLPSPGI